MLSGTVFSMGSDRTVLSSETKYLGTSLSQLAQANTKEHCSFDVANSGLMMQQAATAIDNNRVQLAIDNLVFVRKILGRVELSHNDCRFFSSMVSPYESKIAEIERGLDQLERNYE